MARVYVKHKHILLVLKISETVVSWLRENDNPGSSGSIDGYSTFRATRFSEPV